MGFTETIHELLQFCSNKKIDFDFSRDGEKNEVLYIEDKNMILINIADIEDKGLEDYLNERITHLKKMFK